MIVDNVKKYFPVSRSILDVLRRRKLSVKAVDGVSLNVKKEEILTIAGESGSGKTTLGKLMVRLLKPTAGKILFEGEDISKLRGRSLKDFRRNVQIIFQDPFASMSSYMKIGKIVGHPLIIHGEKDGVRERVLEVLESVGLTPPEKFYDLYPYQLSGGQAQRVAIARSVILKPKLIIADEPVSMLDVSIRASILNLFMKLKEQMRLTYVFILHDLALAKHISDRIVIMYLGKIMEIGSRDEIFSNPLHPYTIALLSAVPAPTPKPRRRIFIPKGEIPNPIHPPSGCRFHPRCPLAGNKCKTEEPPLVKIGENHYVACHKFSEVRRFFGLCN